MGGRATEGPGPHGGQAGWGDVEADVEDLRAQQGFFNEVISEVWRGQIVESFEGEAQEIVTEYFIEKYMVPKGLRNYITPLSYNLVKEDLPHLDGWWVPQHAA